jgi:hypothetical protein
MKEKITKQQISLAVYLSIALSAILGVAAGSIFNSVTFAQNTNGPNYGPNSATMSSNTMRQDQISQLGLALPYNAIISIPFGQMSTSGSSFVIGNANTVHLIPKGSIITMPPSQSANSIFGASISVPFGSIIGPCSPTSFDIGNALKNTTGLNIAKSSSIGGESASCLYLPNYAIKSLSDILPPNTLNSLLSNTPNSVSNQSAASSTNSQQGQPSTNSTK